MKEKVESKFTPAYMATAFPKPEAVQKFFDGLAYDFARYKSKDYNNFVKDGKGETAYSLNVREKEIFENDLEAFRLALQKLTPDTKDWSSMKHRVYTMERKLESIIEDLKNATPSEMADDVMQTTQYFYTLESIHQMVDHIGAWFEEGHAGPGTVKFQGKTFTAS